MIIVNTDKLLAAVKHVLPAVQKTTTLPILSHCHIAINDNGLLLTGFDMSLMLRATCEVLDCSAPVSEFTLPAHKLYQLLSKITTETVQLDIKNAEDAIILKAGKSKYKLEQMDALSYPAQKENNGESIKINVREDFLLSLLDLTRHAMAVTDVRYFLVGTLLKSTGKELIAVATDGHRLAKSSIPTDGPTFGVIIPRPSIDAIRSILSPKSDNLITLEVYSNALMIDLGGISLQTALVDGRFPDYERVMPRVTDYLMFPDDVIAAVERAALVATNNMLTLNIDESSAVITSSGATEEIDVENISKSAIIGLNSRYLLDALKAIKGQAIIGYIDGSSTVTLEPVNHGEVNSLQLIMPVRV